jgi:predicted aspartyl protease
VRTLIGRSCTGASMITALLGCWAPLAARSASQHSTALVMRGDWAVVEVRLGADRHPYRFIVDTAAGATVIDQALAARFSEAASGTSDVQGASGAQSSFQNARLRRLKIAGLSFRNLDVVVTDMAQFSAKSDQHYDGILGNDVLSHYSYVFDVPNGRLSLIDADRPDPRRWGRCIDNPLLARPDGANGFLSVPVSLHGGAHALGIVDTGAGATILNWPAASASGLSKNGNGVSVAKGLVGFDPRASTASYKTTIADAAIGSKALPAFTARLSDLAVFEGFGLKDKPGMIVGANIWRTVPFAAARGAKAFCGSTI